MNETGKWIIEQEMETILAGAKVELDRMRADLNYKILWTTLKETLANEITRLTRSNGRSGSKALLRYHSILLIIMSNEEEKMRSKAEVTK